MTFLITAGPTIEDIDPVRFITNRASGKLGVELAKAALAAGQRVIFIHGPLAEKVSKALPVSPRFTPVPVRSAREMHSAVMRRVARAKVVVMNAAVADFTPAVFSRAKIKKAKAELVLCLKPTADILCELGRLKARRKNLVLVGFALETGSAAARLSEARRKLREKNLDALVLDSPHAMGAEKGDFTLLDAQGNCRRYKTHGKRRFARALIKEVINIHNKDSSSHC